MLSVIDSINRSYSTLVKSFIAPSLAFAGSVVSDASDFHTKCCISEIRSESIFSAVNAAPIDIKTG